MVVRTILLFLLPTSACFICTISHSDLQVLTFDYHNWPVFPARAEYEQITVFCIMSTQPNKFLELQKTKVLSRNSFHRIGVTHETFTLLHTFKVEVHQPF